MTNTIEIYVVDLAAYNNGILHGVWIDATLDVEEMQEQVDAMLKASPVEDTEEYAIHDHEGLGDYRLDEYAGLEAACSPSSRGSRTCISSGTAKIEGQGLFIGVLLFFKPSKQDKR